jgi:hypothetical protein
MAALAASFDLRPPYPRSPCVNRLPLQRALNAHPDWRISGRLELQELVSSYLSAQCCERRQSEPRKCRRRRGNDRLQRCATMVAESDDDCIKPTHRSSAPALKATRKVSPLTSRDSKDKGPCTQPGTCPKPPPPAALFGLAHHLLARAADLILSPVVCLTRQAPLRRSRLGRSLSERSLCARSF